MITIDVSFLILRELLETRFKNLEELSRLHNISMEIIWQHLLKLNEAGYINKGKLTIHGLKELGKHRVDNAVILAAGVGSRFVPLTYESPKGLLKVRGEPMIERQIKQLLEVGITDITVIVGYMKEKFVHLTDLYGAKLIYSPDYADKNNLSSLYHARKLLKNTYILSSDNYMLTNLFHAYEKNSWYSVVERSGPSGEWHVETDKTGRIIKVSIGGSGGIVMIGPVFVNSDFSSQFVAMIEKDYLNPGKTHYYWENTLADNLDSIEIYANICSSNAVFEFENLEELRAFDSSYNNSNNKVMAFIAKTFQIKESEIAGIKPLKLGMTNESFLFEVRGCKYVCRIPGGGTKYLIDRRAEYETYKVIAPYDFADKLVTFNPDNGFKITEYEENARIANSNAKKDLQLIMSAARWLHQSKLKVPHHFDLNERIKFFENLCIKRDVIFHSDYLNVREDMEIMFKVLMGIDLPSALCHIDIVCDNCLIYENGAIRLIDWEYSGMSDPMVDIAFFAIYSGFTENKLKELIGYYYYDSKPTNMEVLRIYIYIALGGFLWYLWALYKQSLGQNFGDYTLKMFCYAKDYTYKINEMLK